MKFYTTSLFCLWVLLSFMGCKKHEDPKPSDTPSTPKLIAEGNGWSIASGFSTSFTRSDYDRMKSADFQVANGILYQRMVIELHQQFDILETEIFASTTLSTSKTETYTPKHYLPGVRYFFLETGTAEYALNKAEPYDLYKNGGPWTQADRHQMPYTNDGVLISSHTFSPKTGLIASTNPYQTVAVFDLVNRTNTFYTSSMAGYNTIGNGRGAVLIDDAYTEKHPGHHRVLHSSLDFVPNKGNYYQLKVADMVDSISQQVSSMDVAMAKKSTCFDTLFVRDLNGSLGALTYLSDARVLACQDDNYAYYWLREEAGYNRSVLFRYDKEERNLIKLTEFSTTAVLSASSPQLPGFEKMFKIPGKNELLLTCPNGLCFALNWETKGLRNLSFEPGQGSQASSVQVYRDKMYGLVYRSDLFVEEADYHTNVVVRSLD